MIIQFNKLTGEIDRADRPLFKPLFFAQKFGFMVKHGEHGARFLAQVILDTKEEVYFKNGNELDYQRKNLTTDPNECELPEGTPPHDPAWDFVECFHLDHRFKPYKDWDTTVRMLPQRSKKKKS